MAAVDDPTTGRTRQRAARVLWFLAVVAVILLFLKFFFADVYRVRSGSMRPTLFGGEDQGHAFTEWVLVRYDGAPQPSRFDLVVQRPAGRAPVVKRAVGLPGDAIRIESGDLLIGGERLGPDTVRPAPIAVFDDSILSVEEFFAFERDCWRPDGAEWELDAREIAAGRSEGMMLYQRDLQDDYIDPTGERITGTRHVNDAVLECDFALQDARVESLRFSLREEADTFEVRIGTHSYDPEGWYVVQLVHFSARSLQESDPEKRENVLAQQNVQLEPGRWHRFRFANIDNHLRAELPDVGVTLSHSYELNEPDPRAAERSEKTQRSFGPRVGFGGEGCRVRFRSIRVLRDLYYTSPAVGTHAIESELSLGPDQYFLLGDHSAQSKDSRFSGPVSASELVGLPWAVVWPPGRARWLSDWKQPEKNAGSASRY